VKGHDSFHARFKGKCRGCGALYVPGDNIWSPGKGGGAYHIRCQPPLESRQASPEDLTQVKMRSDARKRGEYST
jgi:hypothetical protein